MDTNDPDWNTTITIAIVVFLGTIGLASLFLMAVQ